MLDRGGGSAMVAQIEDFARSSGIERMSLETGTNEAFKPARDSVGYGGNDQMRPPLLPVPALC